MKIKTVRDFKVCRGLQLITIKVGTLAEVIVPGNPCKAKILDDYLLNHEFLFFNFDYEVVNEQPTELQIQPL